eukprot:GILI01022171.1.p1 GENE.GILI01022171.1~~GILI01022171.1.p1  ORF type:complete len:208 (+),score=48.71 GILI01022171.1:69-692(+)
MTARKVDIIEAITQGDAPMVHTILCAGLDPNLLYSGQTALMVACEHGQDKICETLIANGANVDKVDRYGRTALHFAARFGHIDCCKVLIGANARDDLRATLLGNETALDFARAKAQLEIVKLLVYGQKEIRPSGVKNTDEFAKKKVEAEVQFGTRSIASGGATGATYAGSYTSIDAAPTPLPPPFAVQPMPLKDETKRLAAQPSYGH